ncbi:hypothetical protein GCM10010466_25550 [Planomonospora alba]|uniref:Uncharacterized protein n=1 Tax=Planomonospora alba TaxID=161354 RepID=A0ABP6N3K6_9ACTN
MRAAQAPETVPRRMKKKETARRARTACRGAVLMGSPWVGAGGWGWTGRWGLVRAVCWWVGSGWGQWTEKPPSAQMVWPVM